MRRETNAMTETTYAYEAKLGANPWLTREEEFPSIGPAAAKLRFLLR